MRVEVVGGKAQHLHVALGELGCKLGEGAELGCADGSKVCWVGEEDGPRIGDVVVEVDVAMSRAGLEVGS